MKDKKILYGIVIAFIFLLSIGLTYAYFSVTTNVVGDRNAIEATVGTLNIVYTDGPQITANNIEPGWTTTKTVKVENTGTLKAYYSLIWSSLTNEIINDELVLEGTCTSDIDECDDIPEQVVGAEEIVYGVGIDPAEEQTYVITFTFIETGSAQNYNQDKAFNGVLNVVGANEAFTLIGTLLDSNGDPKEGATIEIHSTVRTGVTDAYGDFEIRGVEVGTHEINIKDSSDNSIAIDSISLQSGETESINGKQIIGNTNKSVVGIKIILGESNINAISLFEWYEKCTAGSANLGCKVITDNTVYPDNISSPYVTSASGIDFSAKSILTNGQGLYTNNKLEDGKNTYFRGGSFCAYPSYESEGASGAYCKAAGGTWNSSYYTCNLNSNRATCQGSGYTYYDLKNNVTFAGHNWRIIRIDENNNIRMILADASVSNTAFNNVANNDNAYVGYMYGDKELWQENIFSPGFSISMSTTSYIYYSTSYARNESNQFYLTGSMIGGNWNTASICNWSVCPVANYYTCRSTSSAATCMDLYKILSYNDSLNANVDQITFNSTGYETAHQNINNSTIKVAVDNWYSTNLSSYTNYLVDAGYCNDRSLRSGFGYLGYGRGVTYYGPSERNLFSSIPKLDLNSNCPNSTRDLFTTSTSSIGNKVLTYPIGLITVDEARYAGLTNGSLNFANYLKFNNSYWTMSPINFGGGETGVCYVQSASNFAYYQGMAANVNLRPSISLKIDTAISSGTGTYDNPYVIE